jgi:hypothetical protein
MVLRRACAFAPRERRFSFFFSGLDAACDSAVVCNRHFWDRYRSDSHAGVVMRSTQHHSSSAISSASPGAASITLPSVHDTGSTMSLLRRVSLRDCLAHDNASLKLAAAMPDDLPCCHLFVHCVHVWADLNRVIMVADFTCLLSLHFEPPHIKRC